MVRDGKPKGFFYLDRRAVDSRENIITDVQGRHVWEDAKDIVIKFMKTYKGKQLEDVEASKLASTSC